MDRTKSPVLVTGAAGFLAAWVIPKLAAQGRPVVAFDLNRDERRLQLVTKGEGCPGLTWQTGDIADTQLVTGLMDELRPESIIHLAALQIPACRADPIAGVRVNVLGHTNILEAARRSGAKRVIYTSSAAAKPRGPANAPANLYGVFKKTDEEIARLYAEDHGLASLGVRPHVVYGIGRDQGETSVMTTAMRAAALGEAYEIPWSGRTCFQLASDIAEMLVRVCDQTWSGARVTDMSSEVESTDELLAAIKQVVPDARVTLARNERTSPTTGFETAPIEELIGGRPRTPLVEGVRQTVDHFRVLRQRGLH